MKGYWTVTYGIVIDNKLNYLDLKVFIPKE